jgi:transcriptional regulator of heat shock response
MSLGVLSADACSYGNVTPREAIYSQNPPVFLLEILNNDNSVSVDDVIETTSQEIGEGYTALTIDHNDDCEDGTALFSTNNKYMVLVYGENNLNDDHIRVNQLYVYEYRFNSLTEAGNKYEETLALINQYTNSEYLLGDIYVKFNNSQDAENVLLHQGDEIFSEGEVEELINTYGLMNFSKGFFPTLNVLRLKFSEIEKVDELTEYLGNIDIIEYAEKIPRVYEDVSNSNDLCSIDYSRLIKFGRSGQDVRQLQECLNNLNYSTGKADGIYSNNTYKGIKAFQQAQDIKVDGIVGPQTVEYLNKK